MNRFARTAILTMAALTLLGPTRAARADELRFPDTAPGRHARAYFEAYNGEEAGMRTFYESHISPAGLKDRPVETRLGIWRQIRQEQGRLTPMKVLSDGPDYVMVLVSTEKAGTAHMRFNCESQEPHFLRGISLQVGDDNGGGPAPPADPGPTPKSDDELVRQLTARADSLAGAGALSGVVMLDKAGTELYAKAFGMASLEEKRPNQVGTRFNLGSINKLFTSVAIRQLAAAGKLKLDDTIDRYLPEYPKDKGSKITIHMLLDHRGGVPDFFNAKYAAADQSKIRTLADWFAFVKDEPLRFEPGTSQAYSNGGYLLLGMIVARVSGEDYYDYVRNHIYAPAGMTRTDHYARDARVDDLATGYTRRGTGGALRPTTKDLPGRGSPAGGGYSTSADLLRFANAIRAGKLPDPSGRSAPGELGLGIMAAGGSPGCNAFVQAEGPYTLVVLTNFDPPVGERFGETIGPWLESLSGHSDRSQRVRVSAGEHPGR